MAKQVIKPIRMTKDIKKGFEIELRSFAEGRPSGFAQAVAELDAMTAERDQLKERLEAGQNPSISDRSRRLAGDVLALSMVPALAVLGTLKAINSWSNPEDER